MKKHFILFALLLAITPYLQAIPAFPYPISFTQPNGKTLTVKMKGDERMHWSESMDGYTLLYNQAGYLTYAQLDEDGNLQPSEFIATDIEERKMVCLSFLNTIQKNLFYSDIQVQLMRKVWEIEDEYADRGDRALTGEYKTLCAFVQFPNKSFVKTISQFEGLMNQLGYTTGGAVGSVRDFFKEASYNQFDLTITLCGIYTAPQNQSYYAGSGGTANVPILAQWLAQQVAAEPSINFADYDSNNDGKVDGFHFIFAGMGQEAGGGSGTIWSHKWQITGTGHQLTQVCKNSKCINVYSCSPELLWGSTITTIGVICHEMSHAFGAPDFYDTDYSTGGQYDGTGNWDLMAEGSWNENGTRPPHQNMYVKIQCFGWVTPVVLSTPITVAGMLNSTDNAVAYRVNTGNGSEHYLLENRQKTKFNSSSPGSGLLIYHVHSNVGTSGINDKHPQRMYPVCASSTVAIPVAGASNYGNINSAGCTFPGSSNKTSFNGTSTPRMFHWTNTVISNKPITNITNSGGLVGFNFMGGENATYYTISATCGANGSISPSGNTEVLEGESQTYTIAPNIHYDRATVLVNNVNNPNAVSTGTYTFTNVTSNQTIHATFAPKTYSVTFNANTGIGSMSKQEFTYNVAQNLKKNSFTKEGFLFKKWATQAGGGGTSYSDQQSISISANITLYAQWEMIPLPEFTITATCTDGGEISPSGEVKVTEGASQKFTILPNTASEGEYKIVDVLVDGASVGAVGEYLFENVKNTHTIHAVFKYYNSIETWNNNNFIQVIPNPAHNYVELRIKNEELRIENVEIFDIYGRKLNSYGLTVLRSYDLSTDGVVINISHLNPGIYFVKAGNHTAKLVVQ